MSTATVSVKTPHIGNTGVDTAKLGMWLFLASEVMFFTALIGSYIVLRLGSEAWPNPNELLSVPVLAINTFILICSSVTYVMGLQAIQRGEVGKLIRFLLITMALGATFLVIKGFDYAHMIHAGKVPASSLFFSSYYTLTGFHGLHVLAGVLTMGWMCIAAWRGYYSRDYYVGIENTGLYWHFVDLVWIVLFAILCLV